MSYHCSLALALRLKDHSEQWKNGTSSCSADLQVLGKRNQGWHLQVSRKFLQAEINHLLLCDSGQWLWVLSLKFHRTISTGMPLLTADRSCQSWLSPQGPSKVQTFTDNVSFNAHGSPRIWLSWQLSLTYRWRNGSRVQREIKDLVFGYRVDELWGGDPTPAPVPICNTSWSPLSWLPHLSSMDKAFRSTSVLFLSLVFIETVVSGHCSFQWRNV